MPLTALAQAYPVKPVRIVTQFVPGSSGDTALRIVTPLVSESLGQPVVIENRPGAGGVVAAELVMRAAADGYSLLSSTSSTQIIRTFMVKNMPFDPVKDFTPITQLIDVAAVIVVHPSVTANSLKEHRGESRARAVQVGRAKLLQGGYEIIGSTPEQFAATIKHEIAATGKIVKAAGIKPE
ncbi:MAG: hypothetical protein A3I01_13945 [Betaproteobacteria bacterium RIFCSPLOWO2_02_FULL_65_24]|nr:MAG: hypothetical protein A3I01_13945 [Betaproteobacteria bacterium RIFCSPLOWO2_02_FULL_65_24]